MRAALYYAPLPDDPLWRAGCQWLGRDPAAGEPVQQPAIEGLAGLTAEPARYGFHATLKPPMRLSGSLGALQDRGAQFAARFDSFALPALAVSDVGGFLALTTPLPCPPLQALADACVRELDACRLPPDEAELARRRRAGLSEREATLLARWGYPYVLDRWQFHMTLSRRLEPADMRRLQPLAAAHFAAALDLPRRVEDVAVFVEAAPGAPFTMAARLPLRA